MRNAIVAGIVLGLLPLAPALAAAPAPHDIAFARQATLGNMAEIAEGQMAATKAASPDVKQFGQRMVADHTANNQQLQALAQQKGITLPGTLDQPDADKAKTLNTLSGPAFDRAYIKAQIAGHQQMLGVMRTEIADARDPDLKAFAQKTAQTVQEHLTLAQQVQAKL